jgi:hypothetical protein
MTLVEPPTDPVTQINNLRALVESFNLRQGIENSLDAKLENARRALEAAHNGNLQTACSSLHSIRRLMSSVTHAK